MCKFFKKKKENKLSEEQLQDLKDFKDYWKERLEAVQAYGGKPRSITINAKMVDKLSNILKGI